MSMVQTQVETVANPNTTKRVKKPFKIGQWSNNKFYSKYGFIWPDHTQLPAEDGTFVKNFQEHPQSMLITDSIRAVLEALHPDGQYAIGQDSGIYWRLADIEEGLEKGAEAPDWFYVPNVPPLLDGQVRRSYVMWQEHIAPLVVMEFVSGNGSEERDKTPISGKFWVYEQIIRPNFYVIYEVRKAQVELYCLVNREYQLVPANERGHYPISSLGVEVGIWHGIYQNQHLPWMRLWDKDGNLLLTAEERLKQEHKRAEQEHQRAEQEHQRAEQERQRAEQERQRAEQEHKRAEQEHKRVERLMAQLRALGVEPEAL